MQPDGALPHRDRREPKVDNMLELKGWKRWELGLLRGAIVVFVFPAVWIAASMLVSFLVASILSWTGLAENRTASGFAMAIQYAAGLVAALVMCRRTWPREVDPDVSKTAE